MLFLSSADGGLTFTPPTVLFPPALLPGQHPSSFNASSLQRALCSEGFIALDDGRVWALAELFGHSNVTGIEGEGTGWKATGFGRVARPISPTDGRPIGPHCWVQRSRFAGALAGTDYDIKLTPLCDDGPHLTLIPLLSYASNQPAWSWAALSDGHYIHADTNNSQVQEPTRGAVFQSSEVCRFWRLVSATHNRTLYMQCANTTDTHYNGWWNGTDETATGWAGPWPDMVPSNIPDAGSKEFLLSLPPSLHSSADLQPQTQRRSLSFDRRHLHRQRHLHCHLRSPRLTASCPSIYRWHLWLSIPPCRHPVPAHIQQCSRWPSLSRVHC